ncbi:hypothetical protein [Haliangium ochraceum]|uniref:Uncharacterized protein n=1 Tax=Haliangium ochraceum (strain DSM 14365 / JCM 11303 / SMP-2) TaxID=502025 RepID=D0LRE8_HALO1|nr:hypothetical protein [Haliangium ochraceum]ACY17176.1 hypothetical protein Hoch_4685 [Haliangium ochraceum DSM 14365]
MSGRTWSTLLAELLQRRRARALARARRRVRRARFALARASDPRSAPAVVYAGAAARARHLLADDAAALAHMPGVLGAGLGPRQRGGEEFDELCVQVFVREKLAESELLRRGLTPLPARLGRRRGLAVDVVELGHFERLAALGDSIGIERPRARGGATKGTLGALAEDRWTRATVGLTAMHVVADAEPAPAQAEVFMPSPRDGGALRLLGTVSGGSLRGTDIAKIALCEPDRCHPLVPGLGRVRGWRPVSWPGDRGASVYMAGASSTCVRGRLRAAGVSLRSERLDSVLLVDIPSAAGDSGAALLDSEQLVLGFLVGRFRGPGGELAVFTPAQRALHAVACDIPTAAPSASAGPLVASSTSRPAFGFGRDNGRGFGRTSGRGRGVLSRHR